ncbi:hypothetical protein [Mesorhizobium sp. B2-5-9]|uniref:hypothetical protein n=1 Tax=Mesorhizobium sp. B2-5-9 TaxID=2589921 RepID=UPI001FEFDAC7|nr:hypothetical protein [Mesorhizobium sp. B2-5-9]
MLDKAWRITKSSVAGFIGDSAFSHGAAMAFFAVTSLGPILLLVVAVAGLVFGQDAARNAVAGQLTGLMGSQSANDTKRTAKCIQPHRLVPSLPLWAW